MFSSAASNSRWIFGLIMPLARVPMMPTGVHMLRTVTRELLSPSAVMAMVVEKPLICVILYKQKF